MKTYSHLAHLDRLPTDYEVTSTQLLYYKTHGFEISNPITDWFERYQKNAGLKHPDLESFHDPRETTYTKYVDLQKTNSLIVDRKLRQFSDLSSDIGISQSWLKILDSVLPPLRFPLHAMQMVAAYIGQIAPSGRLAIAFAFQAADEMRWIQTLAYRIRQIQKTHPAFGTHGRDQWQADPEWQPLRKYVERMLVTYDWTEAFVALNMTLKPFIRKKFLNDFAKQAAEHGDHCWSEILGSLDEDNAWHAQVTNLLGNMFIEADPENQNQMNIWQNRWGAFLG